MKYGNLCRHLLLGAVVLFLTLAGGCTVTPHANLGVGVDFHNGSFQVRPRASIGVHGRP